MILFKKVIFTPDPKVPCKDPFLPALLFGTAGFCHHLVARGLILMGTLSSQFCPNYRTWKKLQPLQDIPSYEAASAIIITMKLLWRKKLHFLSSVCNVIEHRVSRQPNVLNTKVHCSPQRNKGISIHLIKGRVNWWNLLKQLLSKKKKSKRSIRDKH